MQTNDTNQSLRNRPRIPEVFLGVCPVDGEYTYTVDPDGGKAVVFKRTRHQCYFLPGQKVHDKRKRKGDKKRDSAYWHDVALTLRGVTYPNGEVIVDVISAHRVILASGRIVKLDYTGTKRVRSATWQVNPVIPVSRCPAAYRWYRRAVQANKTFQSPWDHYDYFEAWYVMNRPLGGDKWALRTVTGKYGPHDCGFDNRLDLPSLGATVVNGVIQRP